MLIPGLALTPGLIEHLRKCGDEPLDVEAEDDWEILVCHADGSELAPHEQVRVEGVLAANRVKAF